MRSDPRRASGEATRHSAPLRSAAVKRFCSRPCSSPACAGRRQIWNTCAQSVRDAFVSLWWLRRPGVVRWNSPAWMTPERPLESSYASAPSRTYVTISASRCGRGGKAAPRRQPFLVENLEGAETIRQRIRPVLRVEGQPDLQRAAPVVVALRRSAERHHPPTST